MRKVVFLVLFLAIILIATFLPRQFKIVPEAAPQAQVSDMIPEEIQIEAIKTPTSSPENSAIGNPNYPDLPPQLQLPNPPSVVKAIYLTSWSGGSMKKIDETIALIKRTELNAVVIDVKDYSGFVSYGMDIPLVKESGAMGDLRMRAPNSVIKKFHDAGIYVIGRITVFQDPILAKYMPGWALQSKATGKIWLDNMGLAWMDPAGKGTWDYVISIAKDAVVRGFDEVNFDYVRFASDGALGNIQYPFWDKKSSRHKIITGFFSYLREQMDSTSSPQVGRPKISADLFGLATVNYDDLGIGQIIEDAYKNFDFVAPMVYPSHYAAGFLGYKSPAKYPYEVMKYSLDLANKRWNLLVHPVSTSTEPISPEKLGKLRPWIQDFDLGAVYTPAMVKSEYQAVYDALLNGTTTGAYAGWMAWDAANTYTEAALGPKQ
jgi:hypothetical protein